MNYWVFTNLAEQPTEDVELKLRTFIFEKLGIEHKIEIGNVHLFGKRYNDRPRPIVARFVYHKDLRMVLDQATWLKNTPFGIHEQFPKPIEDKRRKLYHVLKDAKRQGKHAVLVRDKLFVNGSILFR
jgi:predicted N-formylglutamate amidohydrolase